VLIIRIPELSLRQRLLFLTLLTSGFGLLGRCIAYFAMAGDAEKFFASGMDGYVSKPIRHALLRAEIDRMIEILHAAVRFFS